MGIRVKDKTLTQRWERKAERLLMGRKIIGVRYMTDEEAADMGWSRRCVAIFLDNDTNVIVQADDEGNEAGVLSITTKNGSAEVLPVLYPGT